MEIPSDSFDNVNAETTLIERQRNNGQSGVEQCSVSLILFLLHSPQQDFSTDIGG